MPPIVRHELKYYISQGQYQVLSRMLRVLLRRDEHTDENGEYHIRSLYFDNAFDDALLDKIAGTERRDKYRIRIYNISDSFIRMECKSKYGSYVGKRQAVISRDLCEQLMAGDPTGLENTSSGLLREVFREMRLNLLHPAVIVDYVREAYMHPVEDVRITFDKQLRTGLFSRDLFNPDLPTVPPIGADQVILEVKYNRILPAYLSEVLSLAAGWSFRSAISKYTLCRTFEGRDF
ncbi:MAG TPA: polyphosphate polymerase domain-containing protein [Candidatus Limnocylindria bacterium]|nr:polyphosphate polymerase domain-containing protein [Candidatus Limnocylindria bacterium]